MTTEAEVSKILENFIRLQIVQKLDDNLFLHIVDGERSQPITSCLDRLLPFTH